MYLLLKMLREYHERNGYRSIFEPLPPPTPPNPNLLKEAIEDAKAVRAIALARAKESQDDPFQR